MNAIKMSQVKPGLNGKYLIGLFIWCREHNENQRKITSNERKCNLETRKEKEVFNENCHLEYLSFLFM